MGCGRRCGCWALSELELERARHQNTLEENARYQRHVQDLRDELSTLHSTVADLERRYSDLSARYRTTVANLDDVNDTTLRLKDHSSELSEENRRLRLTSEKLEEEVGRVGSAQARLLTCPSLQTRSLRGQLEEAREHAEEEHRRRVSSEMTLSRDLTTTEKHYASKLRRAHSLHDLDRQHLEHDIDRLQHALTRQKQHHRDTIRDMYCHHGRLHRHHYCLAHSIYDCYDCLHHDPMLLD